MQKAIVLVCNYGFDVFRYAFFSFFICHKIPYLCITLFIF